MIRVSANYHTVAAPGFPRGGGANLLFAQFFPKKLHENEEILGWGGGRVPRAPLDPPLHLAEITLRKIFFARICSSE